MSQIISTASGLQVLGHAMASVTVGRHDGKQNIPIHAAESGGIQYLLAGIPPAGFLPLRLFSSGLSHIR